MVAKKDEDVEKKVVQEKVVQVKAKTGAWWKSTKSTEVAEGAEDDHVHV